MLRFLQSLNADVIGIQEALGDQVDFLDHGLASYNRFGVGREDGAREGEHCAIYVRRELQVVRNGTFWFSDTPSVPNSRTWGNRITRITTWIELQSELGKFVVTNSHLDHESDPSREKSVKALVAFLEPWGANFVSMGDFNMPPSSPNLHPLFLHAVDALHAVQKGGKSTFNGWNFTEAGDQIDFMFCGPHFVVETADSLRVPYSDHYPVVATVTFRG
jgi:endonuclease/exonuclease/phosphatase family metal-dependent hydrolase